MSLGMELGLGQGDFVFDGDPASPPKRGRSQIFGSCLLWPNGWIHQDATWYGGRPQPRGLGVRWGPSPPSQKGGGARGRCAPIFGPRLLWPYGCMQLGTEVGLGLRERDIVFDVDPASPENGHTHPTQFLAHVNCG